MEMPEPNFEDHRYSHHIGLARPYGMSQVKTKSTNYEFIQLF